MIATASLPDGRRLAPYAPFTLTATATGNPTTGTWTASPLPTGLTLNQATGVISGSPSLTAETTQVVIGFTQTGTGLTAVSKTLTLTVLPAAPPEISTTSLPNGTRFQQYAPFTLTATGNPVGTWTASPLPPGLILNQATGVISGTPTVAGDTSVLVGFTQTNTGVAALSKTFTLHVDPALAPVISTANLPQAVRYQPYTTQLTVAGNPVGTWTSTALPVGMSFDPATGVLSGTPRNAGITSITFGFTQENSGLSAASKTLELEVLQAPPVITTAAQLPNGSPLTVYDIQLQVAPAPIGKWTLVAGATPLGVTLKQDGQLSGFPTLPVGANYKFTIRFTETSTGLATDRQFFLKLS